MCCSSRYNGCSVWFFAIEGGPWGFSAESVRSCLHSLGFNNKLCRKTLQTLSSVPVRCSFKILSNLELMQKMSNLNWVSAPNNQHAFTLQFTLYDHLKLPRSVVELLIKGIHTCYANVIWQCLNVFPVLWSSNDQIESTLSSSISKTMFLLHSPKFPIQPSFSLKSLKNAFIKVGGSSFDLHAQQDRCCWSCCCWNFFGGDNWLFYCY